MEKSNDEARAHEAAWKLLVGVVDSFVLKYAIEKRIVEEFDGPGKPTKLTLTDLAKSLGHRCTNRDVLSRLMTRLVNMGFFTDESDQSVQSYKPTPLAKFFLRREKRDLAAGASMQDNTSISSDEGLIRLLKEASASFAIDAFKEWVERDAAKEVFEGVDSLTDVGGESTGKAARSIVCAFPKRVQCKVLYDPNAVAPSQPTTRDGPRRPVEFIPWKIFSRIDGGKAVMLMSVLDKLEGDQHLKLLKQCLRAIPKKGGKVIIVTNIIGRGDPPEYERVGLGLDMMKMTLTGGKERTDSEWRQLLFDADFDSEKTKIKRIQALLHVIEAFPKSSP